MPQQQTTFTQSLLTYQSTNLINKISKRKSLISQKVKTSGIEIIDIYHGEMVYRMSPQTQTAIELLTKQMLKGNTCFLEDSGELYSKSQPKILRQLAAQKLFPQFLNSGISLATDDIIVCPYSSLVLLETALMTIAKPGGIILCPTGFYKSNALHIEKFGLQLRTFETDLGDDARITPEALRLAIQKYRSRICGALFTMPGNPLVTEYTDEELETIGHVLVEEKVKIIVDAPFTGIQNRIKPLALAQVEHEGKTCFLHEQTLTITGLSKGHHASGPYKIGAATSGDKNWLAAIKRKLVLSFQRETTALARAVLENTPLEYLHNNEEEMIHRQKEVKKYFSDFNKDVGENALTYFGSAKYGPFVLITFRKDILEMAGIKDSWQLADMLLAFVGLNCVSGARMGLNEPCVRININAPRINTTKDPQLIREIFSRFKRFVTEILYGGLTYTSALFQIGEMTPVTIQDLTFNRKFVEN